MRLSPLTRLFLMGAVLLFFNLALFYLLGMGQLKTVLAAGGWMERPEGAALFSELKASALWVLGGVGSVGLVLAWLTALAWTPEDESRLTENDWRQFEEARAQRPSTATTSPREIYIPGRNFSEMLGRIGDQDSLLLTVINSMNEGVLLLNEAGRIVLLNPSARRILDVTEDAALGRHYLEVIRHAGLADLIGQSKDGQTVAQGELELLGPEDRTFSVNVGAVRDSSERVLGQIMVFADISALKRLMKMRSDFAANVSHELKTPLTAILGYVETLQAGAIDDKKIRGQFLEKISSQSRRLHDLIEDVLELSRIESGRNLETFETVQLKESVGAAVEVLSANAQAKRIRIVDLVPEGFAVKAQSDGLQRIFVNLLDNAVKYSPEDTTVTISSETAEDGWTVVRFADEGYGIPTQHLSRIFERFYRAEMSRSRSAGGTGLGLAIVKHLAERFGGTLSVESAEGKGSTFTVTLPAAV